MGDGMTGWGGGPGAPRTGWPGCQDGPALSFDAGAGDVVFTKNGAGTVAPYILERLDDVVEGYRQMYGAIRLGFCHRKGT